MLTNSWSLVYKMAEIWLWITSPCVNSCVSNHGKLARHHHQRGYQASGPLCSRTDTTVDSGKSKIERLCLYRNNDWCASLDIIRTHCSPDIEYLTLKCRPFYMLREFTSTLISGVYILLQAMLALVELHDAINSNLIAVTVDKSDFNQTLMHKLYGMVYMVLSPWMQQHHRAVLAIQPFPLYSHTNAHSSTLLTP